MSRQTANGELVQPDGAQPKDDLRGWLEVCCGRLLGVSGGIPHGASLFRFGFNSILATELKTILEERFGARVELSLLAEGPSLERLAHSWFALGLPRKQKQLRVLGAARISRVLIGGLQRRQVKKSLFH